LTISLSSTQAAPEEFIAAIHAFLQWRVEVEKRNCSIIVGLIDEHGSRIVSCGNLSKGSNLEVDGDTIYEIGSITKTFTGLLLQDLIDRGEVKADDPIAKYLPATVRVPTRHGKQIALHHLATHTSGLPRMPDNLQPKRADNLAAEYDAEKLYAFLSRCELPRNPGAQFEYSNVGLGLLGHIITLKTGTDFESLVVEKICRPLKMESTRVTLTPQQRQRLAQGHNQLGYRVPGLKFAPAMLAAGAMCSTANDLVKYVSANLGLMPSDLTALMQRTHQPRFCPPLRRGIGLTWMIQNYPQGRQIVMHGGGTNGYSTYCGFDKAQRRGVVVLSNTSDFDISIIGQLLIESEWRFNCRPKSIQFGRQIDTACVGRYRLTPDFALGMLAARAAFHRVSKALVAIPAVLCLAALAMILRYSSHRWIVLGGVVVVSGLLLNAFVLAVSRFICRLIHPVIGVRREGDRFFIQPVQSPPPRSSLLLPLHDPVLQQSGFALPEIAVEILPDSDNRDYERVSGAAIHFSRSSHGKITGLTAHVFGGKCSFDKISEDPPPVHNPPATRTAIKPNAKLLESCIGQFTFPASAAFPTGIKLSIWRQNDQLVAQAWGTNVIEGAFDLYAESEADFFLTVVDAQLTFTKNPAGEVTTAILHLPGQPHLEGKKA
jgi:CubicO group peptidase (beta-lactamase class C family)